MSLSTEPLAALIAATERAPDGEAWLTAFRAGFSRLRESLPLHQARPRAAGTFEAAAVTARDVASASLPLGLALVMHLYPLCALRCVSLPWFSMAHRRRAHLLRAIDGRGLMLANAGSERAAGTPSPLNITRVSDGLRLDGTFDYVSLAHVADLVLFSATCDGRAVFCAAELRAGTVTIGGPRFAGGMRLSDTCTVTFDGHLVAAHRFIEVPSTSALDCMAQYQRSWFHLLLGEAYLARTQHLQALHQLPHPADEIASLNELSCLREYALHLLDHIELPDSIASLSKVTAAIKLRISWLAQATAATLQNHDAEAARELGFIRLQPTSDDRILRRIGAAPSVHRPLVVDQRHAACTRGAHLAESAT